LWWCWLLTFFCHNLCFKYLNESWELILNIYIPKAFQYYKTFFNSLCFDPCNCLLKIWCSSKFELPKWEFT
jgi:hypothetical protein